MFTLDSTGILWYNIPVSKSHDVSVAEAVLIEASAPIGRSLFYKARVFAVAARASHRR